MNFKKENKKFFFTVVLFIIVIPFFSNAQLNIESGDTDVELIVEGCNNNNICEPEIGENIANCPLDCPFIPPVDAGDDSGSGSSGRSGSRITPAPTVFPDPVSVIIEYAGIQDISVKVENKNVFMTWQNPNNINFDFVRVMKSNYYSTSPYEGKVIYEGVGQSLNDMITEFDKKYHYTFFAKYKDGRYSAAVPVAVNVRNPFYVDEEGINPEKPSKQVFFSPKLNIFEILFSQNNVQLRWKDKILQAQAGIPVNFQLPKKNFFGPIYDVYIYADFYNVERNFLRQEIYKMDYNPSFERYEADLSPVVSGERIFFEVLLFDENRKESSVSGIINISAELEDGELNQGKCLGNSVGWERVLMYLKCDWRWIILVMIFMFFVNFLQKRFILKKY